MQFAVAGHQMRSLDVHKGVAERSPSGRVMSQVEKPCYRWVDGCLWLWNHNHMNHMNHINIYTYLYDTTNTNPSSLVGGSCSVVHFFGDIKPQRPRSQIGKKRKKYRT